MKHTVYLFLAILTLALVLSSCSVDHQQTSRSAIVAPPAGSEAEWTVLYYGAGNNAEDMMADGQSRTLETIHNLQRASLGHQINIAALFASPATDGRCGLYEVHERPAGRIAHLATTPIADWGRQDMSSSTLLKQFVDSMAIRFPARHYVLILGGTGEGWKGACRDDLSGGRLMPLPALKQALSSTNKLDGSALRFDIVLWLVPGMSRIEVGYELKNVADYMVATPSLREQPGFMAADQWLVDLDSDPAMSAERLGQFMVSRMASTAAAENDTLASFALMNLSLMPPLAETVSRLGRSLSNVVPGHSGDLLRLWQSTHDERIDDSTSLDLADLTHALRVDDYFGTDALILQNLDQLHTTIGNVIVNMRTARPSSPRGGITLYFPPQPDSAEAPLYHELLFAQDQPQWLDFLASLQETGSAFVTVQGAVRWPGQTLQHLFVFLNTADAGAPTVALVSPITLTNIITPDHADFTSTFALSGDSLGAYLGLFQDLNNDQQLSPGDRYGYYHVNSASRDWITIHNGEQLDGLQIDLTRTF